MMRLQGRVAVVTGASRGIGKAIALAFGKEGAAVVVAARTEQVYHEKLPGTIYETADAIKQAGGRALAVRCDVSKEEDLVQLVQAAHQAFGPIDLLVNNAAVFQLQPFLDMPLKRFRLHFEVNVFAPYRLMQLVLPDMIARGGGSIINISSLGAEGPGEGPYRGAARGGDVAYGTSKAALQRLSQSVAREMAQHGISVNTLAPSLSVPTPGNLFHGTLQEETESPEDFAEAAVRLALETPATMTGRIAYSQDILHPELGRRGWLGRRNLT